MHGIIHEEYKKYIEVRHGVDMYRAVLERSGLGNKFFMPVGSYDDEEFNALVEATQQLTGATYHEILEDFGEFITPDLIDMYSSLVDPTWKTVDFLTYAEERVHPVVRLRNPGSKPPVLKFTRLGPDELHFHYDSPRHMSAIARGIMKGVANHYHQVLNITETPHEDGSIEMHIHVSDADQ